jgi:hypothetical protein
VRLEEVGGTFTASCEPDWGPWQYKVPGRPAGVMLNPSQCVRHYGQTLSSVQAEVNFEAACMSPSVNRIRVCPRVAAGRVGATPGGTALVAVSFGTKCFTVIRCIIRCIRRRLALGSFHGARTSAGQEPVGMSGAEHAAPVRAIDFGPRADNPSCVGPRIAVAWSCCVLERAGGRARAWCSSATAENGACPL